MNLILTDIAHAHIQIIFGIIVFLLLCLVANNTINIVFKNNAEIMFIEKGNYVSKIYSVITTTDNLMLSRECSISLKRDLIVNNPYMYSHSKCPRAY